MRKSTALLLLAGCIISLTACQNSKPASNRLGKLVSEFISENNGNQKDQEDSEEDSKEKDSKEKDSKKDGKEKNNKEKADKELDVEDQYLALRVVKESNNSGEWNGSRQIMEIGYDFLSIEGKDHPGLSAALENYRNSCEQQVNKWKQDILPSAGDFGGYCDFMKHIQIQRADSLVLSFVAETYEYTGGAHGGTYYESKTYDSASGRELTLSDVAVDLSKLADAVVDELEKIYSPEHGTYDEAVRREILAGEDGYAASWSLGYHGITFYYGSYELGSYAMGCPQAFVPFAQYPGLFREEYTRVPSAYAVYMEGYDVYDDTDGDGEPECIFIVRSQAAKDYGGEVIRIYIDETVTEYSIDGYYDKAYLIRQEDGKLYLYVGVMGASDVGSLEIFQLSGEKAVHIGHADGYFHPEMIEKPSCFKMTNYLQVLGSHIVYRYVCVGDDGMPKVLDENYSFTSNTGMGELIGERSLTTKIPIPVWMIYEGNDVSTVPEQLPAGTRLYFRKTDGKTFVEMELEDGRRCQVRGDFSGWPCTINGMDEQDCFDGILHAG